MSGHAKMPPASHQVSATSLKLLIQQIHPHVRVERDLKVCSSLETSLRRQETGGGGSPAPEPTQPPLFNHEHGAGYRELQLKYDTKDKI